MDLDQLVARSGKIPQGILGYLNFSSGAPDRRFLGNLNDLFGQIEGSAAGRRPRRGRAASSPPAWTLLRPLLEHALGRLQQAAEAFRQADQARAVLDLVFGKALPAYRDFHRDLLFHQSDESLFTPFFLGRVFEAVLRRGPPWEEHERIVAAATAGAERFYRAPPGPGARERTEAPALCP